MIKKIFKSVIKILLGIMVLIAIAYFSFFAWEYVTGDKFVNYINRNIETVTGNESFTYEIMKDDIENSKLILVGETHGFHEPTVFDVDFFKYLYKNYGIRNYIAELDYAQASFMNIYLQTGDEDLLQEILKNWIVVQGRNNKDYLNKYRALHKYYQQLPDYDKFKFIGIDKIQDWKILTKFTNQLSEIDSTLKPIIYSKETIKQELKTRINKLLLNSDINEKLQFELSFQLRNIEYSENKKRREEVMSLNFSDIYKGFNLYDEKLYGFFGLYHVFQYRVNGKHPMASQIRQSELGLEDKILSINFLFVDSYMVTKSSALPEFMRDKGKYTRMNISTDNLLFMYIYGIMDFKRTTSEHYKSIIKMNSSENNPYENSSRMAKSFQILPVTELWEMTDKGKPYTQYTIFVRNSDWAEPERD